PAEQAQAAEAFESGLIDGVTAAGEAAVGVELTSTQPSQIPWYQGHDMPSVDDLDAIAGQAALIYALDGSHGAFGSKPTADTLPIAAYALGVLTLGLIDDALGGAGARGEQLALRPPSASGKPPSRAAADVRGPEQPPRGWRGHGAAALRGEWSTGALKGAGSLGLALFAVGYLQRSDARWLLAAAVVVLATNLFNLLDLRPGRAIKAFVLLGAGLLIGSGDPRPLWALGLFAAPALVAGSYDVRERAMLGDTGASLLGAL